MKIIARRLCLFAAAFACSGVSAQVVQPVQRDGELVFPPDAAIPKTLTPAEAEYIKRNPIVVPQTPGMLAPPTGPIACPGEFGPMEGILFSYLGTASWQSIIRQMVVRITNEGQANAYIIVPSTAAQTTLNSALIAAGANMSRVRYYVRTLDTIWIRDYGPRYIYEGGVRGIIDHTYNRPRPNDDIMPQWWATVRNQVRYALPLVHGGGNYHLDSVGRGYATSLILNENPSLSAQQVIDLWRAYQNVDTSLFSAFPSNVDSTQHIDMWMQVTSNTSVMISDWDANRGSTQDTVCNNAAAFMAGRGYTVTRVPARLVNGVHYTYTNVVMCNDIVLVPSYSNASVSPLNAVALASWQQALPGKQIFQINCDALVTASGVMHCIVMHVPANLGGANPSVYQRTLRGGETLAPGVPVVVRWSSDDDVATANVSVLLSLDGGQTYPRTLAQSLPDVGSYTWNVPNFFSDRARIRVLARDGDGNTGFDATVASFTINGCRANFDQSGDVNVNDFFAYLSAFAANDARSDITSDGVIDIADFFEFLQLYSSGC